MSDWEKLSDEENAPAAALGAKGRWDGEDEDSSGSGGEWDAESSSGSDDDEGKKGAGDEAKTKKKSMSERIAERQAERQAKLEAAKRAAEEAAAEEDPAARRERERQMQMESELMSAQDLFAGVSIKDTATKDALLAANPKTQGEFDEFRKTLVECIQRAKGQRLYAGFLDSLVRELALPLKDEEVKKMASTLTALANEKQRAFRDANKGKKGKNKKASLVVGGPKSGVDMNDYTRGGLDEFEDFM
ncbi:Translation initiation factor 3 subunit J component [Coemansia javaensis]|uniref:Eukaryotic translation initiation factor 3 30 kDa subunit n=1 Tax=Coemansia javaensis TaxID=2761396 RepID=A0A9W8HFC7_9FUNG|nr:Translation initiation factor 3 subunit J component [Coemansia javaensis]